MIAIHSFQQVTSERLTVDVPPEFLGRQVEVVVVPLASPDLPEHGECSVVDRGRGPQLNNSRITVQDVWPYLEAGCSYRELAKDMPLTPAQFTTLVAYIREHEADVRAEDAGLRQRNAGHGNSPTVEAALKAACQERLSQTAAK